MEQGNVKTISFLKRSGWFLLGLASIGAIGSVDFVTGHQTSLSVFYLIPVTVITNRAGIIAGILTAVLSALTWTATNLPSRNIFSNDFSFYWNTASSAAIFIFLAFIVKRLKRSFEHEKESARKDEITGIANIRAFLEVSARELERSRRYKRPVSAIYLDCDNFKSINDDFGHETGNAVLQSAAQAIQNNIRTIDMVARMGGDEFMILLSETAAEGAKAVIERLRKILSDIAERQGWSITFSMGAAVFLSPPDSVDEMIRKADSLMYAAKQNGGNQTQYETFN